MRPSECKELVVLLNFLPDVKCNKNSASQFLEIRNPVLQSCKHLRIGPLYKNVKQGDSKIQQVQQIVSLLFLADSIISALYWFLCIGLLRDLH